jgi:hypothetical protein
MEKQIVPLKKKRPATKTEIGRELKAIYANNENGEPTDFKTFNRAKRTRRWPKVVAAVLGLFILAGIAWAGILRFGGSAHYGDNIVLTIDGPTSPPRAGDVSTWTIRYQNNENIPLAQANLTVNLPVSITILSSDPQLVDMTSRSPSWDIGTIAAEASGTVTIRGRVLDAVGAPIAIQASLTYIPANFNANFEKPATWSSKINDAAITATLVGPNEAVPGDDQTFTLTISRQPDLTSDALIPDLKINFDPNNYIVIKNAVPAFDANDDRTWSTPAPAAGKPLVFTVTGSFASTGSSTAGTAGNPPVNVLADVGTIASDGSFMEFVPATAAVNVLPGDLVLTLIRNGLNTDSTVGLGDDMNVSIDYENDSPKTIGNAEIDLTAAGTPSVNGINPVNWSTLNDIRGGIRTDNTIAWTKNEIPDLGSIAAGAKGSIDISFKTISSVFTTNDRNYNIDLSARGVIGTMDGKESGKTVSTPIIHTLINSDASVSAAASILPGSLPLAAGQASTYRVVWVISNSLHEINGIKVTAQLPDNVSFVTQGDVEAGDLEPPDSSGNITWTLDRLPTSFKSISADFTVSVTPSADDKGKDLPLLGQTTFTATDKDTGGSLAGTATALTTANGT